MLRKYSPNLELVLEYMPLEIYEGLTYTEELVRIMDQKEKVLHTTTIPIVKVLWCNHRVEKALWEAERDMHNRYPHLFETWLCMTFFSSQGLYLDSVHISTMVMG